MARLCYSCYRQEVEVKRQKKFKKSSEEVPDPVVWRVKQQNMLAL